MAHFEIHVNDVGAAKAFYGHIFGWDFAPMAGVAYVEDGQGNVVGMIAPEKG